MGMRVLVVGEHGSGRTALCNALAFSLKKKGKITGVANLDPTAKRLPFEPAYDIRAHTEGSWDSLNAHELEKSLVSLPQDIVFMDFGPSIAEAILNDSVATVLAKTSDRVLFVVDATKTRGVWLELLGKAIATRLAKPTLLVLNKSDLVKPHPLLEEEKAKGFEVSAIEGKGIRELCDALIGEKE